MAHGDAAGVNGSNRILSHGAPLPRMMPNGCLGSPVIVLLLVLTEASSWMSDRRAQNTLGDPTCRGVTVDVDGQSFVRTNSRSAWGNGNGSAENTAVPARW